MVISETKAQLIIRQILRKQQLLYIHMCLYGKFKISFRIMIGDIGHNFTQHLQISGVFTVFHPGTEQITEDPAEIFMSGVGQKASGISQHSHKTGQISQVSQ